MAEIDSHPLIPIFRRHVRIRMPVVAGCVVHKNVDRAESGLGLCNRSSQRGNIGQVASEKNRWMSTSGRKDRKSTRLNSSHVAISYAVFCLKKKKKYKRRHY